MGTEESQPQETDLHAAFKGAVADFKQNILALSTAFQSSGGEVSPETHSAITALGKKVEELHAANN